MLAWPAAAAPRARFRVIVDNDFAGDPDGLFQIAHQLLSPSTDVRLIVASHLHGGEPIWNGSLQAAASGAQGVRDLIALLNAPRHGPVLAGSEVAIADRAHARPSPATAAIIAEAMRDDDTPLVYAAGAGLTELALAWLAQPQIGRRMRLVWIGGSEHPGRAYPPPGKEKDPAEYNFTIDRLAAQIVFNESDIEIWQVPRNAYRQMLVSAAELDELARSSAVGRYLREKVTAVTNQIGKGNSLALGETYVLGDSPLVTLTALQSPFEPDPSSSRYAILPTPRLAEDGSYLPNPSGRPMRVFDQIDARLTFADMAAKFRSVAGKKPA
jgi:inosine-uridine nucleoside N-ribohydrolase